MLRDAAAAASASASHPTHPRGLVLLSMLPILPILCAALLGCERRIDEPTTMRLVDPSPGGGDAAPADKATPAPPTRGKGRCIKATAGVAERTTAGGPDPACPRDNEASPPRLRGG